MNHYFPGPVSYSLDHAEGRAAFDAARSLLLERVRDAELPRERLLRLEVALPPLCVVDWLAAQRVVSRYYWCDRRRDMEMAGLGEAMEIASESDADIHRTFDDIQRHLPEGSPTARFYGGFRFHPNSRKGDRWQGFKACRFVAPLLEIFRENNAYRLVCSLRIEQDREAAGALLETLSMESASSLEPLPHFYDRSDLPCRGEWDTMMAEALGAIDAGLLKKVVLARQTTFHASGPVDPVALMQRLSRRAGNVYLFCFQPRAYRAFMGASPECLYRRDGLLLRSEALAGTRPRGDTPEQDRAHEINLKGADKDSREHRFVVEHILNTLGDYCTQLRAESEPGIVKLAHCQHLLTPIFGELQAGVEDDVLLEALHPTPAVGGNPTDAAMRWILEKEPFERGIYAAPVGWMGNGKAEFCVGIRSGLVLDDSLTLYAGAGIVPGSDPEEEWREIDAKMEQILSIILEEH